MRWEDIENIQEEQDNNATNPFVAQEPANNQARNGNLQRQSENANPTNANHGANQNVNANAHPTTTTNAIQNVVRSENVLRDAQEQMEPYEEIIEEGFMEDQELPAEIMNAPDVEFDDEVDLEYYDLERDRKKIKTDEH